MQVAIEMFGSKNFTRDMSVDTEIDCICAYLSFGEKTALFYAERLHLLSHRVVPDGGENTAVAIGYHQYQVFVTKHIVRIFKYGRGAFDEMFVALH